MKPRFPVEEETLGMVDCRCPGGPTVSSLFLKAFDLVSGRIIGNLEELCSHPKGCGGEEGCYPVNITD